MEDLMGFFVFLVICFVVSNMQKKGKQAKTAVIWADFEQQTILDALREERIKPLSANIPDLTPETIMDTATIVAQMGHEPILEALQSQCDIIVCGRSYDPSPFAALGWTMAVCF